MSSEKSHKLYFTYALFLAAAVFGMYLLRLRRFPNVSTIATTGPSSEASYEQNKGLGRAFIGGMIFGMSSPHAVGRTHQLVFSGIVDNQADIFLLDENKNTLRQLTKSKCWDVWPSFSSSGTWILFVSDMDSYRGELYAMQPESRTVFRVAPHYLMTAKDEDPYQTIGFPCNGPGKDAIAFSCYDVSECQSVYITDLNRPSLRMVSKRNERSFCPVWSAKKNFLVYTCANDEQGKLQYQLCICSAPDFHIKEIGEFDIPPIALGTSKDEREIVVNFTKGFGFNECKIIDVASGIIKPFSSIHSNCSEPIWNPANDSLIYISSGADKYAYDLFAAGISGGDVRLTSIAGYLMSPSCSDDGESILFATDEKGAPRQGLGTICRIKLKHPGKVDKLADIGQAN